jgi:hypothetical protein
LLGRYILGIAQCTTLSSSKAVSTNTKTPCSQPASTKTNGTYLETPFVVWVFFSFSLFFFFFFSLFFLRLL